ncbi:putative quinol monooxygenase [Levilactobacillus wangkuiensis]|uniref:putative quinol monooxygenase n=1 Tax=Levilactobacillus wangkuiensis TaxID=2799566 RepID=UPI0019453E17|nr:antibiotic biosynthesis monooxygenase [Levilactobacillus wangkuiensis]
MTKQSVVPLFRLFKLEITAVERENFVAVGTQNLTTSIQNEPGTLAMYTSHVDPAGLHNRVIEVYRDAASYEIHAHSPQFAAFQTVAKRAVTQQTVVNLTPKLLLEQSQPLYRNPANEAFIQLMALTVQPGQTAAYQAVVVPYLQAAMAAEPGLQVGAVGQVVDAPDQWVIFTVYQDLAAFKAHCQTAGFKQYQAAAQPLIQTADATVLTGDTLVNHGGLAFTAE